MKIDTTDGQIIDTEQMTNEEAEIFEKQHELCMLAQKYDIPFFAFTFGDDPKFSRHVAQPTVSLSQYNERISKLLGILNWSIKTLTNNELEILPSKYNPQNKNKDSDK